MELRWSSYTVNDPHSSQKQSRQTWIPQYARRRARFAVIAFLITGILVFLLDEQIHNKGFRHLQHSQREITNVLVFNGRAFHDEVYTAFLESLSRSRQIKTSIMLLSPRWQIEDILAGLKWQQKEQYLPFPNGPLSADNVVPNNTQIIIDITCGADIVRYAALYEDIFLNTDVILHCVVHHADTLKVEDAQFAALRPWVNSRRLRVFTLSEHVKKRLRYLWNEEDETSDISIDVFVPVFNALLSTTARDVGQVEAYFAIQGAVSRRNNLYVFSKFENQLYERSEGNERSSSTLPRLYLVGNGRVKIPPSLTAMVMQKPKLNYPDFYSTLANSLAILPAISAGNYTQESASSTFPASIIAGVPPVVTEELLAAYSYLQRSSVIVQREGEDAVSAAFRYLDSLPRERGRIVSNIRKLRDEIILKNALNMERWIYVDSRGSKYR